VNTSLKQQIQVLRAEKNAVILAHNYQVPEVQDVADFVGDSLELSRMATRTEAKVILFCGVYFMAETAKILSPEKTVIIPDEYAGCPMVDMAPVEEVNALKKKHPAAVVVTYVNSSAAVKAVSDYCCTSANAVQVINALPTDAEILFVPDRCLGGYVEQQTGRKLILYPGYCPTHLRISEEDVVMARQQHPAAKLIMHPECRPEVAALADAVLSTSGMCRYVAETDAHTIIVGTEQGLIYRLQKENPEKKLVPLSAKAICPNMKKITLEKVLWALQDMSPQVIVPETIRLKALKAVERMVSIL